MRCSKAATQLQLYIDNRLTMEQVRMLEAHLAQCASCRNDLYFLEEVSSSLHDLNAVAEPAHLTLHIMQRVAQHPRRQRARANERYSLLRPSLLELLAVVFLATITTLGIIWDQPTLRAALPFANGHDSLSQAISNVFNMLMMGNAGALAFALWIGGTIIGICITLALVGNDIRAEWFKAMVERLPVR